jgi:hypothetical protein
MMFTSTKSIDQDVRQNTGTFVEHIPTSQLFGAILKGAPKDRVTLAWLLGSLRLRSFGIVMLLLGAIAMLPGISILAAFLLVAFGFQMMMAHEVPILPRFIARRTLALCTQRESEIGDPPPSQGDAFTADVGATSDALTAKAEFGPPSPLLTKLNARPRHDPALFLD